MAESIQRSFGDLFEDRNPANLKRLFSFLIHSLTPLSVTSRWASGEPNTTRNMNESKKEESQ